MLVRLQTMTLEHKDSKKKFLRKTPERMRLVKPASTSCRKNGSFSPLLYTLSNREHFPFTDHSPSSLCSLSVLSLFTLRPLTVHSPSSHCSLSVLSVHSLSSLCSLFVLSLFTLCPLTVHSPSSHCSLSVLSLFTLRPLTDHSPSSLCSLSVLSVHSPSSHCSLSVLSLITLRPLTVHSPSSHCSLFVLSLFTLRPLSVHSPSSHCSLFVLSLFTLCPLSVHSLSSLCSLSVLSLFTLRPLTVHSLSSLCSLSVLSLFTLRPLSVHSPSSHCSLSVLSLFTLRPLTVHSPSSHCSLSDHSPPPYCPLQQGNFVVWNNVCFLCLCLCVGHEDQLIPYSLVQPVEVDCKRPVVFSPSLLSRRLIERLLQPAESGLHFNTCQPEPISVCEQQDKSVFLLDYSTSDQTLGIRLQNIQEVINQDKHCLLELGLSSVEGLLRQGLYPIVIHIKPKDKKGRKFRKLLLCGGEDELMLELQAEELQLETLPLLCCTVEPNMWSCTEELLTAVRNTIHSQQGAVAWVEMDRLQ
uniref:Guanylate kinase-like domain-containing protein n=1 Tax=Astyanax mexicanus TaxID=7994 RepID=A0A3B1JCQ1_ASTMX